jgi:hypothetical protein
LVLLNYETNEEAEYAAIQARDARVAADARRYNREYMTYIGQKRIKHLLTLQSPEECEDFFGELEPTQVERSLLGCDILIQQTRRFLDFYKYNEID